MAVAVAKFAAKVTIAGGVLYWSIQQGIWGTGKEGAEAGKRLTKAIVEPAKEIVEKIPSLTDVKVPDKDFWNARMSSLLKKVTNNKNSPDIQNVEGAYTSSSKLNAVDWNRAIGKDPRHVVKLSKSTERVSQDIDSRDANHKEHMSSQGHPLVSPLLKTPPKKRDGISPSNTEVTNNLSPSESLGSKFVIKTPSFKLNSDGSASGYSAEPVFVTKSSSPPRKGGTGDGRSPKQTSPPKSAQENSKRVVIKGFNYVTSLKSPPKQVAKGATSVRIQSTKPGSPTQCSNIERGSSVIDSQAIDYEPGIPDAQNESDSAKASVSAVDQLLSARKSAPVEMSCNREQPSDEMKTFNEMLAESLGIRSDRPTPVTLLGGKVDEHSPPRTLLFAPSGIPKVPTPVLMSNPNPGSVFGEMRSPRLAAEAIASKFGSKSPKYVPGATASRKNETQSPKYVPGATASRKNETQSPKYVYGFSKHETKSVSSATNMKKKKSNSPNYVYGFNKHESKSPKSAAKKTDTKSPKSVYGSATSKKNQIKSSQSLTGSSPCKRDVIKTPTFLPTPTTGKTNEVESSNTILHETVGTVDDTGAPRPVNIIGDFESVNGVNEIRSPQSVSYAHASKLSDFKSPNSLALMQALGSRSLTSLQKSVSDIRRAVGDFSPPTPTVIIPSKNLFKGLGTGELTRSTLDQFGGVKTSMKSPYKGLIANISPPTPTYTVPSPIKLTKILELNENP